MEQQKEYRSIVKTTALFGGVQAFQVLLTLVRTKVVALLLGVDGVGLLGLLINPQSCNALHHAYGIIQQS